MASSQQPGNTEPVQHHTIDDAGTTMRCQLLELPRELRDEIYHFAFTFDQHDQEVDLYRDASPPSKSLCCTNKQIYLESKKLYKKAFRSFWQNTRFVVYLETFAEFATAWSLDPTNIDNIRHITIYYRDHRRQAPSNQMSSYFFSLNPGGLSWAWACECPGVDHAAYVTFVIGFSSTKQRLQHARQATVQWLNGPIARRSVSAQIEAAVREKHHFILDSPVSEQLEYLSTYLVHRTESWVDGNWAWVDDPRAQRGFYLRILFAVVVIWGFQLAFLFHHLRT